jgi:hypothetical protein
MAGDLTPLSRRLLAVVVVLSVTLIGVVLQAWRSGDEDATLNPVAEAAETTKAIAGLKIAIDGRITSSALPGGAVLVGEGEADGHTHRTRIEMTLKGPGLQTVEVEQVASPEAFYLRTYPSPAFLGDKHWVVVRPGEEVPTESRASSTGDMLGMLRACSDEVETLGRIRVRGTMTTAYRAHVDLGDYADYLGEHEPQALKAFEAERETSLGDPEMTVWIDGKGYVRRIRETQRTKLGDSGATGTIDVQVELFDFDTPQHVDVPAAGDTYDMTEQVRAHLSLAA